MSEVGELLAAARECEARGEPYALATVVAVRGSSYRRPGARLLAPAQSAAAGVISGGCLEAEAARLARDVLASGVPRVATIDHSAEGDEVWGSGLGCRGAIDLLLEPPTLAPDTVAALRSVMDDAGATVTVLLTVVASDDAALPIGMRLRPTDQVARQLLPPELRAAVASAEREGRPRVAAAGAIQLAIDPIGPPPRLLVCGAGPDAEPLVRLARELGWRVTVADWRRRLLDPARFPGARLCHVEPRRAGDAVAPGPGTAAVLMSHDYLRDAEFLRGLAGRNLDYVGVLGPRDRSVRLLDELRRDGVSFSATEAEGLHAPAGLDLGADGPAEVATAIVAEILAVLRGRSGAQLRDRPGPIHGGDQPPM